MKLVIKFAFQYMKYYQKQSFSIFLSIVITVALIMGVGSLLYSGEQSNLEKERELTGDYHYYLETEERQMEDIKSNLKTDTYTIKSIGAFQVRNSIEEPYIISFVYGDNAYLKMLGREVIDGRYPEQTDEIALDDDTIRNLNVSGILNSKIILGGKSYTLCGILSNRYAVDVDAIQVFTSETTEATGQNKKVSAYIKFDENGNISKQRKAFMKAYQITRDQLKVNWAVTQYLGEKAPLGILYGLKPHELDLVYVLKELKLSINGVIFILGIFSAFIIYSIFHISILKRTSQYGVLEILGADEKHLFGYLFSELGLLFAVSFPIGTLLGIGAAKASYLHFGKVFVEAGVRPGKFYIPEKMIVISFLFLLVLLLLISLCLVKKLRRYTANQIIQVQEETKKLSRICYSTRTSKMTTVLIQKYMFGRKGTFIGILVSLA